MNVSKMQIKGGGYHGKLSRVTSHEKELQAGL